MHNYRYYIYQIINTTNVGQNKDSELIDSKYHPKAYYYIGFVEKVISPLHGLYKFSHSSNAYYPFHLKYNHQTRDMYISTQIDKNMLRNNNYNYNCYSFITSNSKRYSNIAIKFYT